MTELATYNLWGDEFAIPSSTEQTKKILNKIKAPKEMTVKQRLSSKKVPLGDKLALIEREVYAKLGRRKDLVVVLDSREKFHAYIDAAIKNGIIAIDTETNRSLDPLTCVLMGPCIYTRGEKAAYIPLHHRDWQTGQEWEWQLTEEDVCEEFQRLIDSDVKVVWHNFKFDYQVIWCTCHIAMPLYWDTQPGAKLIDENESAKLKDQYSLHIDPEQESYSIEEFFNSVEYADVPPALFALYAALDAMDTLELYDWQYPILTASGMEDVYKVFQEIELPILEVTSAMELTGIEIDQVYAQKLSEEYHKQDERLQLKIDEELLKLKPTIDVWRQSPGANQKQGTKKSKAEQLKDPVELGSPTQLAILLYDVMRVPVVDEDNPRGTGEEVLAGLADEYPLCKLMLERRENSKLLTTFIDKLPELISPADGRLHSHFNSTGTRTGRFSSTNPNLQQIPSHNKVVRMMFRASCPTRQIEEINQTYTVSKSDEVQLSSQEWKSAVELRVGDELLTDTPNKFIKKIEDRDKDLVLYM